MLCVFFWLNILAKFVSPGKFLDTSFWRPYQSGAGGGRPPSPPLAPPLKSALKDIELHHKITKFLMQ